MIIFCPFTLWKALIMPFTALDYSPEEFEKGFGPWIEKQV